MYRKVSVVEAPIKLLVGDGLVGRVMVGSQVLVGQALGGRYPCLRVEDEHALQEVDRYHGSAPLAGRTATKDIPVGPAFLNLRLKGSLSR